MKSFSTDCKLNYSVSTSSENAEGFLVEHSSELVAKLLEEINLMKARMDKMEQDFHVLQKTTRGLKKDIVGLKKDSRVLKTIIFKKLNLTAMERAEFS